MKIESVKNKIVHMNVYGLGYFTEARDSVDHKQQMKYKYSFERNLEIQIKAISSSQICRCVHFFFFIITDFHSMTTILQSGTNP